MPNSFATSDHREHLIVGSIGLHKRDRGLKAQSMGLLYTLIQSPGYHANRGVVGFVGMFAVFTVVALIEFCTIKSA